MVKSKVALMLLVSIVFSISMKASLFSDLEDSAPYHDRDGVGYNLEDYYGYWFWGVDGYNRNLTGHEDLGGHTIHKHVGKYFAGLRSRCSEIKEKYKYRDNFRTTYTTFNQAKWSIRKLIKANFDNIKRFERSRDRDMVIRAKYVVNVQRKFKYGNYNPYYWYSHHDYFYFYGKGINCNANVLNKVVYKISFTSSGHMRHETIYKDQYTRLRHAKAVLRRNGTTWFILTSYPYHENKNNAKD